MSEQKKLVKVELEKKQEHKNIFAALSAFQGELKPLTKSGKVQFETNNGKKVDFNYTPLGEIMTVIYPLLSKHGLSVRHEVTKEGVEAIVTHETFLEKREIGSETLGKAHPEDGARELLDRVYTTVVSNEIRSGIVTLIKGSDMKDLGGAITYARRYSLTMALGISSEDDKDADLLEQSAKNAIQTVYTRFKAGLEGAKTAAEAEKSMGVLRKDLETIGKGKAPALGLSEEQYKELIKLGEAKVESLKVGDGK